jgi:hypothetical protein
MIYFIQSGKNGPVKIGRADDVQKRLKSLQTAHPETLILRAIIPGDLAEEQYMHRLFAAASIRGEWFKPTKRLREYLAYLESRSSPPVIEGSPSTPKSDLPYVDIFRDRHGHIRCYFRRYGRRVRLPGVPGSAEFTAAYSRALRQSGNVRRPKIAKPRYRVGKSAPQVVDSVGVE